MKAEPTDNPGFAVDMGPAGRVAIEVHGPGVCVFDGDDAKGLTLHVCSLDYAAALRDALSTFLAFHKPEG
jgi:hypothetical protein